MRVTVEQPYGQAFIDQHLRPVGKAQVGYYHGPAPEPLPQLKLEAIRVSPMRRQGPCGKAPIGSPTGTGGTERKLEIALAGRTSCPPVGRRFCHHKSLA